MCEWDGSGTGTGFGLGGCVNRQHGVLYGSVVRDWQGMNESGDMGLDHRRSLGLFNQIKLDLCFNISHQQQLCPQWIC